VVRKNIIRVLGNIRKQMRVFLSEARAYAHWVDNVKGLDDDQLQTSWRGSDFVDGDCDPRNCTGSCPGTRHAGFLPEPWCRIPIKRDSGRYGIGTQRFVCERASEAHFSEELRQLSQDVTGRQIDRSGSSLSVLKPGRYFPWF
jgi:hypothetical protein